MAATTHDATGDTDEPASPSKQVIKIRPSRFPGEVTRKRSQTRIRKAHMQSNESDEEFEIARAKASTSHSASLGRQSQISNQSGDGEDEVVGEKFKDRYREKEREADEKRKRMSLASVRFYDHAQSLLALSRASIISDGGVGIGIGGAGLGSPRASDNIAALREVDRLLPFALVNPERPSRKKQRPISFAPSDQSHSFSLTQSQSSPPPSSTLPHFSTPHAQPYSPFTRMFRWGTIDILNSSHCDFVPLRTSIFGSHLKALRKETKEKYERYRTEKLLIRRARRMKVAESVAVSVNTANTASNNAGGGDEKSLGRKSVAESWVDVGSVPIPPAPVVSSVPFHGANTSKEERRASEGTIKASSAQGTSLSSLPIRHDTYVCKFRSYDSHTRPNSKRWSKNTSQT